MKTLEDVKAEYISKYKTDLKALLEGLDSTHRPTPDRINAIVETNASNLYVDDLLVRRFAGTSNPRLFGIFPDIPLPNIPLPNIPLPQLAPLPDIGKEGCILVHMAIAAAVLAAWVASGGTLIVGTAVAGVTITNEIIAALIGGATGRALAEKFC